MKTLLKIVAGAIALLFIAAVCLTLYFRFVFDPNDLRDQITQRVQDKTGRELVIEGDLKISTFPWISAEIGRTTLSDDPALSDKPLLSFNSASASIKLMPLLSKQIELGTTAIDGGSINLIRLTDGTTNWGALLNSLSGDQPTQDAPVENASGFAAQSLGAIDITDGTVVFQDQLADGGFQTLTLSGLTLETGELKPNAPFNVDLATRMDATDVGLDVTLTARAELTENLLDLDNPRFTVNGSHYAVPFGEFGVELDGDNIKLGESSVNSGGVTVNWSVSQGRDAAKDLASGSGSFKMAALSANDGRFALAEPELDFDFGFGAGTLTSLKGSLTGDAINNNGTQIEFKEPTLDFDANGRDAGLSTAAGQLKALVITLTENTQLGVNQAAVSAKLNGESIPDGPQSISAALDDLALNLDSGALNISQYSAEGFGLKGRGKLTGTNVLEAATLTGPLTLERFDLRKLMTSLDVALDTADASALTRAEGTTTLRVTPQGLELRDIKATLDQSQITGLVNLTGKTPNVSLNIDALTLDGYLSPPDNIEGETRAVDTIELPAQTLRDLNLNGQLRIGALDVGGIKSTNVDVQLAANDGNVRIYPMRAQLYGGTYSGDVKLNAQGEVPTLSMNESFNDVNFGDLTQAMVGDQRLSGRVTGSLKMTARGHNTRDLKATSNGSVAFEFKDGVLDGINVMETVRNIVAAANKEAPVADEPNKTEFREMKGTATITEGVLSNNDLSIDIPLMRINGQGSLDLNTKAINYRVGARVVQEGDVPLEKELRFLSDYTLPLVIGGTYEAPRVDASGSVADLVKQYAKKRLQDSLFDKLGLGKKDTPPDDGATPREPGAEPVAEPELTPEEKKEQLKDELDQKLKDKLKDLLGGD